MKYVWEYWAELKGYQACNIHQVISEFKELSLPEMDSFCGILADNITNIEDPQNAATILKLRQSAVGL